MKIKIYFISLLATFYYSVSPAQLITIRQGIVPLIDGQVTTNEWSDADSVLISLDATSEVTVKFKHDGTNFYFAFLNNLESYNVRFPEVLIDVANDKSSTWMQDDWWFHVSATDCESNAAANDYGNCQLTQPGWTALNNFTSGSPFTDTVEIQIPFAKVNFQSVFPDTIGIAFDVTNTFSAWNFWPPASVDLQSPATWGSAVVTSSTSGLPALNKSAFDIDLYPNPVKGEVHISPFVNNPSLCNYFLWDMTGKLLQAHTILIMEGKQTFTIPFDEYESGVYSLECNCGTSFGIKKIIKL